MRLAGVRDQLTAALLLSLWCAAVVAAYWDSWSIDMSAVYMAGLFVAEGDWAMAYGAPPDFFSKHVPEAWSARLARHGLADEFSVPFVYPPVWAWLVAPFAAATDPMTFFNIGRIAMTACFAASVLVAWRLARPPGLLATPFALVSVVLVSVTIPFQFSMDLNQPQALVVLLILLAFERVGAGRALAGGACLGLAAAIKVSPLLLAVVLVAERNWRAAAAAAATAALLGLASLGVAGIEPHLAFLERVRHIDGLVPITGLNMTFETMMHDFFVPLADYPPSDNPLVGVDTPWVSLASKALLLAAMAGALWCTRPLEAPTRLWVRLLLVYLAVTFFGPLAWMHYYTLPLLLAPGLWGRWPIRKLFLTVLLMFLGFSSLVMEGVLDWSLARGDFSVLYPQHTALLPLAVFAGLVAAWAARAGPAGTGALALAAGRAR